MKSRKGPLDWTWVFPHHLITQVKFLIAESKLQISAQIPHIKSFAVGEYGILIADTTVSSSDTTNPTELTNDVGTLAAGQKCGLIFYQAGVAVLTACILNSICRWYPA